MERRIEEFLSYLLADRGYSPRTINTYQSTLKRFVDYVREVEETLDWSSVDVDLVRRWMAERMTSQRHARTVKRDLSGLRSFYRYLNRMGHVAHNPANAVQNPKVGKALPVFLKQREMDLLLDHTAFADNMGGRLEHLVLLTLYTTGIRISELLGLTVGAVNLTSGELKVTGKRNKQRIIPFGEELSKAISDYLAQRVNSGEVLVANSPLLVTADGSSLNEMKVRKIVKTYLSTVTTATRRTPHVLRHTFATAMLNNGADLSAVKELLGHESLAATEVYTHVTFASLRSEYEKAHPRSADAHEERS